MFFALKIFQGKAPKSVLARHYTDFSPEKLKKLWRSYSLCFEIIVCENRIGIIVRRGLL